VDVKVVIDPQEVGPVDLIIVLVKSNHTRAAMEGAGVLIDDKTVAMSLQNGIGNEEVLAEYLGAGQILSGRTYVGGVLTEPGVVQAGIKGKETFLGELDGSISERAEKIAAIFNESGLKTRLVSDIQSLIWQKLLINVSTGAICGITGLPYGKLLQVPEAVQCAVAAVMEAMVVGSAAGVALDIQNPKEVLDRAVEGLPFDFKPSILQDIERGLQTEIDFINGAVVRFGEKFDIETPVNRTLVAAVKGIESGFSRR